MTNHPVETKAALGKGDCERRPSHRAAWRALPIAVAGMLIAAASLVAPPAARAAGKTVTVEIANFTYSPAIITIAPGTKVIWVNHDDSPHTVTETKDAFGSAALDTDDSFAFTFTAPGDYAYFCMLHPQMAGKVVVRPAAG